MLLLAAYKPGRWIFYMRWLGRMFVDDTQIMLAMVVMIHMIYDG